MLLGTFNAVHSMPAGMVTAKRFCSQCDDPFLLLGPMRKDRRRESRRPPSSLISGSNRMRPSLSAVTRGCPESMKVSVYQAIAHDFSSVIDRKSALQIPPRVLRDEGVEVHRHFALPNEGG